jgi:hypothetical protein
MNFPSHFFSLFFFPFLSLLALRNMQMARKKKFKKTFFEIRERERERKKKC